MNSLLYKIVVEETGTYGLGEKTPAIEYENQTKNTSHATGRREVGNVGEYATRKSIDLKKENSF